MRTILKLAAWSFSASVVVFASVNAESGVVYQNPVVAMGLGMIGLGLCLDARKRALSQKAAARVEA